jgi:RNA polymerase sigma-70 factor (ECF subfamily)
MTVKSGDSDDTDGLIRRARGGDAVAEAAILAGQRDRLRRMIANRLDRRVSARVDPSDVVQEALADASLRLSAYLQNPPLPLFPWLYQFARERLAKIHRHHIRTGRRSVERESPSPGPSCRESGRASGHPLIARGTSPSGRMVREEARERVRIAMGRLPEGDRAILARRHIEALSMAEIAAALGISVGAAKVRHLRALRRLQTALEDPR